jgi:Bifunctional DNA primase/polymerase, N-terminal
VLPIKFKDKKPAVSSWEQYQKDKPSLEQIKEWFDSSDNNKNNIAIITGKVSKIIGFDIDEIDAQNYFEQVIAKLHDEKIESAIRNTMHVKTGNGNINVIIGFNPEDFADEDDNNEATTTIKNSVLWKAKDVGKGHSEIRLKGDGGYIVAPPSTSPCGNRYELLNGI